MSTAPSTNFWFERKIWTFWSLMIDVIDEISHWMLNWVTSLTDYVTLLVSVGIWNKIFIFIRFYPFLSEKFHRRNFLLFWHFELTLEIEMRTFSIAGSAILSENVKRFGLWKGIWKIQKLKVENLLRNQHKIYGKNEF